MTQNDENLHLLLQQFVDEARAASMAEDIRYADAAFDAHPAPTVPQDVCIRLRHRVADRLLQSGQRRVRLRLFGTAAAVLLVLAGLAILDSGIRTVPPSASNPVQHAQIRLDGFFSSGLNTLDIESDISELFEAIEDIDVRPYDDKPVDTLQLNLNEIEDQCIANSTDFWKG